MLFAFEEAIGFMFAPTVLDKDGVSAACHLATMGAFLRANGQTFIGKLNELYQKYGFHYTKNSYFLCYEPPVVARIFERIRNFQLKSDSVRSKRCSIRLVEFIETFSDYSIPVTLNRENIRLRLSEI